MIKEVMLDVLRTKKTNKKRNEVDKMDEMKCGMKIAYQSVKDEMNTIVSELSRKGKNKPKEFIVLEQFLDDSISDCEK